MELFPEFDFESSPDPVPPDLSDDRLTELYQLAGQIRELEPWKKLRDQDIFGIEDPDTGKISIVSVLGKARQVFAFQLYLPEEGIRFWNEMIPRFGEPPDTKDLGFRLRLLECGFDNKGDVDPHDIDLRQRFGEPSRKRHSWPVFRSHRPGYIPWFLEEEEAARLILAMRLFLHHREDLESNLVGSEYFPERDGRPVIPVLRLNRKAQEVDATDPSSWEIGDATLPVAESPPPPEEPEDELFAARLESLPVRPDVWEILGFWLSTPIFEGPRPYFPKVAICLSQDSEDPPNPVMYGGEDGDDPTALRKTFEQLAAQLGYLPSEIRVASDTAEMALRAVARATDVEISRESQEFLPPLASAMSMAMQGGGSGMIPSPLDFESGDFPSPGFPEPSILDMLGLGNSKGSDRPKPKLPNVLGRERYTLRIDLGRARPPLWRRISLPADATFFHLHLAIQDSMGWMKCHLYEFLIGKGRQPRRIGPVMIEEEIDHETSLRSVLGKRVKQLHYVYDFGDSWDHRIKVESLTEADPPDPEPRVIKGKGICPPEDCGGIWGFQELLDGNPEWCSEWGPEFLEWLRNGEFRPESVTFSDPDDALRSGGMMY